MGPQRLRSGQRFLRWRVAMFGLLFWYSVAAFGQARWNHQRQDSDPGRDRLMLQAQKRWAGMGDHMDRYGFKVSAEWALIRKP